MNRTCGEVRLMTAESDAQSCLPLALNYCVGTQKPFFMSAPVLRRSFVRGRLTLPTAIQLLVPSCRDLPQATSGVMRVSSASISQPICVATPDSRKLRSPISMRQLDFGSRGWLMVPAQRCKSGVQADDFILVGVQL